MSDSLAIEWGERLVLLQGKASGRHVHVRRAVVLEWPEEIDAGRAPEAAAQWLKGELISHGFNAKQTLVSLPREQVVLRHLELPGVPDEELPGMVKLQAATKVTLGADQYLLDYVPLPPREAGTRDVLMTTVPTEVTGTIQKVLTGAGLEITSIGVSSFHAAELATHQQDAKIRAANQLHLVVSIAGKRVEVCLVRGTNTLAASSTRVDGQGENLHKAVNAEVSRMRLSAQDLHGGLPISHIWVGQIGPDAEGLCEFLKSRLHADGMCFDPLGGTGEIATEERGYFTAPTGHLFVEHGALTESVNYLAPRKAAAKRDTRKLQMILAGVGVVAVLGTSWWMFRQKIESRENDIADVNAAIIQIDEALDAGKNDVDSAALVRDWENMSMDWLAHMQELNSILPGGDLIVIEKYNFRPGRGAAKAGIHIEGYARGRAEVDDFSNVMQSRGYAVPAPSFEDSNRDENYETFFTMDVTLPLADASTTN